MKNLFPVSILFLILISSCNQLYRAIPKAPRHRVVIENKEAESNQFETDLSLEKTTPLEIELNSENENGNEIQTDKESIEIEKTTLEKQKKEAANLQFESVKDTLFVDADVLEKGNDCVRLQTVANVGTSLMFLISFLSIIFIAVGIYNIYTYNNLPYVTQETDDRMQRKINNFYIALGIYLFLILLIVTLIIFL